MGIACFHHSLLSALWHNWKSWNDGNATAPWERVRLYKAYSTYSLLRRLGVSRSEAIRAGWRMPKMVEAQDRLDQLLREHPETHPEVVAAKRVLENLKRVKPPVSTG